MSKVTFNPAPLVAMAFAAGTAAGALVVHLADGAGFDQAQSSDGTNPTVYSSVPDGSYTLTYGMRKADDSDWITAPYTTPVTVSSAVTLNVPNVTAGGTVTVGPDDQ